MLVIITDNRNQGQPNQHIMIFCVGFQLMSLTAQFKVGRQVYVGAVNAPVSVLS